MKSKFIIVLIMICSWYLSTMISNLTGIEIIEKVVSGTILSILLVYAIIERIKKEFNITDDDDDDYEYEEYNEYEYNYDNEEYEYDEYDEYDE